MLSARRRVERTARSFAAQRTTLNKFLILSSIPYWARVSPGHEGASA